MLTFVPSSLSKSRTMYPRLTPEMLIRAYSMGIFPMGDSDNPKRGIRWYGPDPRCILDLDDFHLPRRLARTCRQGKFRLTVNKAWSDVIKACATRETTWITEEIFEAYTELHRHGLAHSVEAWQGETLAGGLYGVSLGGAFMGESMFHTVTDASKVALVYLVHRLKDRGFVLLDCQFMTEHLQIFGARDIPQSEYLSRLSHALSLPCRFD